MPLRARVAVLALVIAGAIVTVRSRQATAPQGERADPAPQAPGAATNTTLTWLMVLTIPFLALLCYSALHSRRQRSTPDQRAWSRSATRGLAFVLALLVSAAVLLALIARVPAARRQPGDTPGADPAVPPDTRDQDQLPAPPPSRGTDWSPVDFETMSIFVVAALATLLIAAAIANRRAKPIPGLPSAQAEQPAREDPLIHAAQQALSAVGEPAQDARSAIIRSYAAFEHALADTPGAAPRPADTSSDVLRRAADAGIVRAAAGWRLVDLFAEARFSAHPMTEDDRSAAADMLRLILDDLRRHAWTHS
ncbi:MAG: DUF4129 domain-containing protein [Haloechinothrix sp.]